MTREQAISKALHDKGIEICKGKGGYWIKDKGFLTLTQAYKLANFPPYEKRKLPKKGKVLPWGEYAWIAGFNGRLRG